MYKKICVFTCRVIFSVIAVSLIPMKFVAQPITALSQFDTTLMQYKGSDSQQINYLLKNIVKWGHIDHKTDMTSNIFQKIAGKKCDINNDLFQLYLASNNVAASEIGGPLNKNLSFITSQGKKIYAKYFIVHDVSSPAYRNEFPSNIDSASWAWNNKNRWIAKKNHVYITRTGQSKTVVDFSIGWRATKMELTKLGKKSRGLYLHIELVQPRVYPPGNEKTAPIAPVPGFTDSQYERLALVYIAASLRKGEWMTPAFHAVIDESIPGAHDDPQHFNLDKWSQALVSLLAKLDALNLHNAANPFIPNIDYSEVSCMGKHDFLQKAIQDQIGKRK